KLKPLTCGINFALILDAFARAGLPNNLDVLARAAQWTIECASMPGGNRLVSYAEAQEKPSSGKVLQGRRLNTQRDGTPAVDVVDGRSKMELARPRGDPGKQDQRIGTVRFAFPERAKSGLFDQGR